MTAAFLGDIGVRGAPPTVCDVVTVKGEDLLFPRGEEWRILWIEYYQCA